MGDDIVYIVQKLNKKKLNLKKKKTKLKKKKKKNLT